MQKADDRVYVWVVDRGDGTIAYQLSNNTEEWKSFLPGAIPTADHHKIPRSRGGSRAVVAGPTQVYVTRAEWDVIVTLGETHSSGWIIVHHG